MDKNNNENRSKRKNDIRSKGNKHNRVKANIDNHAKGQSIELSLVFSSPEFSLFSFSVN